MERSRASRPEPGQTEPPSRLHESYWLALLALGVVMPFAQLVPWLLDHGLDLGLFVDDLFANRISSFFAWDVTVAVLTLLVVVRVDRQLTSRQRWLVGGGSLLGASVGLPLYLLMRERSRNGAA